MDPASASELRDIFTSGNIRMEQQEEQIMATGHAVQSGFCDHSVNWTSSSLGNDGVGTEAPLLFFIPVLLGGTQEGVRSGCIWQGGGTGIV